MKGIYTAWFGLFLICAYGGYQVVHSNFHIPLPPTEFSQIMSLDPLHHKHNPFGDYIFYCQTQFCNPTDYFIGMQTGVLYKGKQSAIDGIPIGKTMARTHKIGDVK